MAPMDTLRITVDASSLSLRRPRRSIRKTDLPDLPEEDEFLDDVACLELSLIPLTLEGGRENRLKEHLEQAGGPETVAHRIGTRLFELIFPTQAFVETYHGVRDDAEGMRLILEFALDPQESDSPVSRWAALPWEYLWDPEMAEFVALRPNCYLIRRLSSGGRVRRFTAPAPLKVVALLAEPWDQQPYGREEARRSLEGELSGEQVSIGLEPQPSFPAMIRALTEQKPHVLHLVAHGNYHPEQGGTLALEDEFGQTHPVPAQQFASQIAGSNVRLVVLNSCLSGSGEGAVAFQGVAQALLRAGVPAVVAMQSSVPVVTAHRFSGALYRALSMGTPLDEAVDTARRILSVDPLLPPLDWAIPVLYMQSDSWSLGRAGEGTTPGTVEEARAPGNLGTVSYLRPTRLLGRGREMIEVARALRMPLQRRRFATLTGMGGIGKTAARVVW